MLWLIPAAAVAFGVMLIVAAARSQSSDRRFAADARRATGTVVGMRRIGGGDARDEAFPIVRFELPDGRAVEAQSRYGSRPAPASEGDTVSVLYDPRDPRRVQIGEVKATGVFLNALLGVVGGGLVVFGLMFGAILYLIRDAI